ncbi:MAG: site-2 protease family protein [Candidatus Magasanikbacteria bacterium]
MEFLSFIFFLLVIIPSAIMHEYAHGWMADQLGDPTARYAGRLTLDPRAHVDKFGTILLPLMMLVMGLVTGSYFLFAYAKPVPYNPYNLRNQKWGPAAVAVAGPLSNLLIAVVFGTIIRFVPVSSQFLANFLSFLYIVVYANVLLAVFNLVPIPPLDGSKVLYAILPDSMWNVRKFLEQYSLFILIFFIFFLFRFISPIIGFLTEWFTGGVGLL